MLLNTDLCSVPLQLTDNSGSGLSALKFPVVDRGWGGGSSGLCASSVSESTFKSGLSWNVFLCQKGKAVASP